jgi:hypothetical protein
MSIKIDENLPQNLYMAIFFVYMSNSFKLHTDSVRRENSGVTFILKNLSVFKKLSIYCCSSMRDLLNLNSNLLKIIFKF